MTWQEELRKLDEDFSSGNITADEYRVRRDQVLSSAVAPGGAEPAQTGQGPSNADATQIVAPVQRPQAAGPEATQVVNPQNFGAPAEPERTQAVHPDWQQSHTPNYHAPGSGGFPAQAPGAEQWQGQHSGGFPAQGPGSGGFPAQGPGSGGFPAQGAGSGGFPAQEQQGWDTGGEVAPPWGGSEYPPMTPPGHTDDWGVQQGPESFDDDGDRGGKGGKIVGIAVAIILLAGLAFGGWWLWGRDSAPAADEPKNPTTNQPSNPASPASSVSQPPENQSLPIATLEGTPGEEATIKQFSDVASLNYLTPDETSAYQTAGAGEANFESVWMAGGSKAIILLAKGSGADGALKAAKELREVQIGNGAKKAAQQPAGVFITEYTDKKSGLGQVRAHYASGDVIVRIEVANSRGIDAARTSFKDVLNAQLDLLPADA